MFRAKEGISFGQEKMDGGKGSRRKGAGGGRHVGCELAVVFVAWRLQPKCCRMYVGVQSQDPKLI